MGRDQGVSMYNHRVQHAFLEMVLGHGETCLQHQVFLALELETCRPRRQRTDQSWGRVSLITSVHRLFDDFGMEHGVSSHVNGLH